MSLSIVSGRKASKSRRTESKQAQADNRQPARRDRAVATSHIGLACSHVIPEWYFATAEHLSGLLGTGYHRKRQAGIAMSMRQLQDREGDRRPFGPCARSTRGPRRGGEGEGRSSRGRAWFRCSEEQTLRQRSGNAPATPIGLQERLFVSSGGVESFAEAESGRG